MAENEAAENEEVSGSSKKPLILFGLIALILIAGSIGGTLFFLGVFDGPEEDPALAEEVIQPAIYFALMPKFKTNYEVNGRQRLFQVAMSLMTRDQEVIESIGKHSPSIKSKLVILLSGQDFTALQTPEGREELRAQCLKAVQGILKKEIGKPGVEEVLFTDFVMQ